MRHKSRTSSRPRTVFVVGWLLVLVGWVGLSACTTPEGVSDTVCDEGAVVADEERATHPTERQDAEPEQGRTVASELSLAREAHTTDAYEAFLGRHPEGPEAEAARRCLEQLEFDTACERGTIDASEEFLAKHPDSEHASEMRAHLEGQRFAVAAASNRVEDLERFLRLHPHGARAEEARASIERLEFDAARSKDTVDAYAAFLRQFPSAPQAARARERIAEFDREAERREKEAPGRARAVFVNDGKLVLLTDDSRVVVSDVVGESPRLGYDGERLVYDRMKLLDRVVPESPLYPNYGTTSFEDGIGMWNLMTGEKSQISTRGSGAILCPSNERLAYVHRGFVYTLRIDGGKHERIARGGDPVWLGDSTILYHDRDRVEVVLHNVKDSSERRLGRAGTVSIGVAAQDPRRWLQDVFRGKYTGKRMFAQSKPRAIDAERAGFLEVEFVLRKDMVAEVECVLRVVTAKMKSRTYLIYATRLEGLEILGGINPPGRFAVDLSLGKAAYSRSDRKSKLPSGVDQAAVFVVDLDGAGRARKISDLRGVRSLLFDEAGLLVATVDEGKARVPLGGGAIYQVGSRSLTVPQLRMMKLDPAIVDADRIWRVELDGGSSELLSGGHGLTGR